MVSEFVNNTLFLYRDGVRLHRMQFYIYECTERNGLKSMIQERCGTVVETKGEHVVCFAAQCLYLEDGEIFSTEYIKQCCESNMLLDLRKFRLGKNPDCSDVDPLEVLKGIASWPQNVRCFSNLSQNNSHNEQEETQDLELCPQKRKRSTRKKNGIEQERRLCHWRQAYSREEDEQIIRYLLKNNNYKKSGTNTLWKKMELQEVLKDRSWQSMKNRLRIIRLRIENYDLCDEDIKKLGGKAASGSRNPLQVSVANSRCCFCCPKRNDCEVANGSDSVRYSCHCSQRMKRQAVTSVENEALVQVESIRRNQSQAKPSQESCAWKGKPQGVKPCHTNRAESFSYANSTPSGDGTEIESEPEHCFKDKSSPIHKTHNKGSVENRSEPAHRRKLYNIPSSDININIKSTDISLLKNKNNLAHKKCSIPLRWPQIYTPINLGVFEKQVAENDTVTPEVLNHKTQNQNRCPDDNGSTVYGSCQPHGMENGSAANSSRSLSSGEGKKATTAVDYPTIVKPTSHSNKTKDTQPDKVQNTLNMRSHSTPKKLFQMFNKRESRSAVNDGVCTSECTKEKLVENRMEVEEGIVSPSFSISDTSSGFCLQMREKRSTNHVNECISDKISSEYSNLQTSKNNEAQHKSQFEITNMLYSDRLQDEEYPTTQPTTAQDIRSAPEKEISSSSSSSTHHQEQSNRKRQSSTGSLPVGGCLVYGNNSCQHLSNYKNLYVEQWLNSIVNYYETSNLSKLPSLSEKLKEVSPSSGQDDHDSKNISFNNRNEETSCAASYINKSFCAHKEISKIDAQGINDSSHGSEDSNLVVNNKHIPSNSSKISVLKDKEVSVKGTSEKLDYSESSQSSSVEEPRKMSFIVTNATETPDRNIIMKRISEPSNQPSAADSKSDNVCHLQSYDKRITPVNDENGRQEPFLQISHVATLCNQEQCFEDSCDSDGIIMESQPSQVSSHRPIPNKQERISVADDSLWESQLSQGSNHMSAFIKQEISIALEDEEFTYEGYSPPVDLITHMSDNE